MNTALLAGRSLEASRSSEECSVRELIYDGAALHNEVSNFPANPLIEKMANDLAKEMAFCSATQSIYSTQVLILLKKAVGKLEEELENIRDLIIAQGKFNCKAKKL